MKLRTAYNKTLLLFVVLLVACTTPKEEAAEQVPASEHMQTLLTTDEPADTTVAPVRRKPVRKRRNRKTRKTSLKKTADTRGQYPQAWKLEKNPEPGTLSLALVGDILMGTDYPVRRIPQDSGRWLFRDCASFLYHSDLALGNLEGPLATVGRSHKSRAKTSYAFEQPPYLGLRLQEAGFDYLCIGNNHMMDMGREGYRQTCRLLDSLQIAANGILGMQPVLLERNDLRIGICSFGQNTYTPRHIDTTQVRKIITELRPRCDILVVSFHGGAEGTPYRHVPHGMELYLGEKRGNLRRFAHQAIDCGADLIVGHGPHVPRALEVYKGRLICYSLGNFCTPYGISLQSYGGMAPLLRVRIKQNGEFVDGVICSYRQYPGTGPRIDTTQAVLHEMERLSREDFPESPLQFHKDGTISIKK